MPKVPETERNMSAQAQGLHAKSPTPEHLLMTAADMHARGSYRRIPLHIKGPGSRYEAPIPRRWTWPRPSGRKVSDADVELHHTSTDAYGPKS